jgi:hypothetical protein
MDIMKRVFQSLSFAFLLFAVLNLTIFAQQKPLTTTVASSSCNDEAALQIIQQQLAETKTFDDEVKRITVMVRAADLLWPHQEEKARAAFVEALDLASQHFKQKGDEPQRVGRGLQIETPDQRYTVISAIAKRDLSWARKLTENLLSDQVNEAKEKASSNVEREIKTAERLLSVALGLIGSNQSAAISFANQSLRFPATLYLPMFLYKLSEVNLAAANQFYLTALAAYAKAPIERLLYLSSYPFGNNREVGEMPGYTVYKLPAGFTPNPDLQRIFVQTLLGRAQLEVARPSGSVPGSGLTDAEQLWLALTRLETQIGRSLPDLAPAVEQAKGELGAQLPETSVRQIDSILKRQNRPQGNFAEQVEAAEKNPNADRRDEALVFAVTAAPVSEDLELVLSVVNKISDTAARAQLLNWLYFSRTQHAIKQKQLAQARTFARRVEEIDQRGYLYFQIAEESLKESADQTDAREMLEEVVEAAAKAPATMISARTQLGVAHLYTKIDPARAIAVLGDAVRTINRLESPDFSRQFVERKIQGKTFGFYTSFQTPGFNPETAMREISKSDFDGTLYQANNFASKPLRSLTTLAVIEPCLEISKPRPKGTPKPKVSKPG